MAHREEVAGALAAALLAGVWTEAALRARARGVLGAGVAKPIAALIAEILAAAPKGYPPSPAWIVGQCLQSEAFERAARRLLKKDHLPRQELRSPAFAPIPRFAALNIPPFATVGALGEWLGLDADQLDWLADERRQHGRLTNPRLQNYHYIFAPKRTGGVRLIEAPKPRLKAIQRRIAHEILAKVPVHPSAHGFVRGRSVLTGAQAHASEPVVVRLDLVDFFPSTRAARVHGVFRAIGYPWAVARALTGLCLTATPTSVLSGREAGGVEGWRSWRAFAEPHLAQGAPTSPALANLCAFRLDRRLSGLAQRLEMRYTRYADDLTFSGAPDDRALAVLQRLASEIARAEGHQIHPHKSAIQRAHARQTVTGIVVNRHANIARVDYDRLKATLHGCARNGPAGHDRHRLQGQVAWVEHVNPARGAKLRALFDQITW